MTQQRYQLVETDSAWQVCLQDLQQHSRLAVDLESNSMYAYRERVCLIQISTPDTDYIIDPLGDFDLGGLRPLMESPEVEKVFHAAEYDLMLLLRDFGWSLQNLFDTMWAVRILGQKRVGLANVLEKYYDVKLDKKFQRSNWCQRPLQEEALRYAQLDTHYLLRLRDDLARELQAQGHWEEAQESFAAQCDVKLPDLSFSRDDFWSMNGAQNLSPESKAVLQALTIFRNDEAQRRDRPPFKILGDRTLLALAEIRPHYNDELHDINGLSYRLVRRYGRRLISLIRQAEQQPPPRRPKRGPRTPDDVIERYEALHQWRKLRARARGVESDVIVSRDELWQIAHLNPADVEALAGAGVLRPWRLRTYGAEIIAALRSE